MAAGTHPQRETILRVGPLANIPAVLSSLGHDPEPVIRTSGFALEEFWDPDHHVSYVQASQLLQNCATATGCEHIGLLIGQRTCPSHLGITGFLLKSASSVQAALRALIDHLDLQDEGGAASLDIEPSLTTLSYFVNTADVAGKEQIYDLTATVMFQILRSLCGSEWRAMRVNIERRSPRNMAPYRQFFGPNTFFDATESAVTFESRWLEVTPSTADPFLYRHMEKEAERARRVHDIGLKKLLPALLRRGLLSGQFSAPAIADDLGIHERTLHRRLQAAGTTFRRELDAARESVSEELLENTRLPVCEIATSLGYADSSSFIRAFQRWTGSSPSSWREQNELAAGNRIQTGSISLAQDRKRA